jgi:dihydrofolate reductase
MTVTIVVAVGSNGVIGARGAMPWPRTGDMRQFKELTWGHPLVMGRTTFESIGAPLPGRTSVVLTRQAEWDPGYEGVLRAASLAEGLDVAQQIDDHVFVVGGANVYSQARSDGVVDELVVTHVPLAPEGDAYFAPIDPAEWTEVSRTSYSGTPDYEIATYRHA